MKKRSWLQHLWNLFCGFILIGTGHMIRVLQEVPRTGIKISPASAEILGWIAVLLGVIYLYCSLQLIFKNQKDDPE